jgi:hypothetical protein
MKIHCLFCKSSGPFRTQEHIIPESLGNDDLILKGYVCDACQNYFGKEVESYVLGKTSFAAWRAMLGIRTKSGGLPRVDLSQPKKDKGRLSDKHSAHDDGVILEADSDGNCAFEIESNQMREDIRSGARTQFKFVMTPKVLCMTGRFLGKVGLEILCLDDPQLAYTPEFDDIRNYARGGTTSDIWPLFHFSNGRIEDLIWLEPTIGGFKEEVLCYSYALFHADGIVAKHSQYTLLRFTIGTDNWVICLNDRYPHPIIREQFKDHDLKLIWYSRDEVSNKSRSGEK